ncbi:MAG TPA: deoxyribonuclease IV [bacterium]
MRLGVHVSTAGGLLEALGRAQRLGCTAMQIFSRSPRGGPAPTLDPGVLAAFHDGRLRAGIEPLAVHAPYIINLASPDAGMWKDSLRLYEEEYARTDALRAAFLVTHVGSHRGAGERAGIARVARAVTRVLAGRSSPAMIVLENTAGSGQGLGATFEELRAILDQVRGAARVGICLDTAHLFAAGYPIHTADGLEDVLDAFGRVIGFERLKLVHLNDSRVPFGARADRHWHIGRGHIGREAFGRLLTHRRLREQAFILETPKGPSPATAPVDPEDRRNLRMVRQLAGASKPSGRRMAAAG